MRHCHRWKDGQIEPPFRRLGLALLNGFRQPDSSVAHLCCLHCLIVWQFLFMLCHFQSPLPPLNERRFPSINEQHLEFASSCTAGCDQTKCGCPASCRRHSRMLKLRRGQSTLKALFVRRLCMCVYVCACIFMCVWVCDSQFPCSRLVLTRHLKVGGLIEIQLSLWSLL